MRRTVAIAVAAAIVTSVALVGSASAEPVPLDTSFSGDGTVSLSDSGYQFTYGLLADGDAVYAYGGSAESWKRSSRHQVVARYQENGRLDTTFASDGVKTLRYTTRTNATDAALTADGRLLVAGWTDNGLVITKLRRNGGLDDDFGKNGVRTINVNKAAYVPQVEVTSTGQLVVAWSRITDWDTYASVVQLTRLRADGSTIRSFGRDGVRTVDIWRGDLLDQMAIGADDRVYASVWSEKSQQPKGAVSVVSLASSDTLWTRVLNPYGRHGTVPAGIGVDSSGRAVLAITPSDSPGVGAMRVTDDGTLDDTYAGDGVAKAPCDCYTNAGVLTDAGMILVGGTFNNTKVHAARFTSVGDYDTAFSGGEVLWNLFDGDEYAQAAAVDGSGRLLVGGSRGGGRTGDAFVARFLPPEFPL